MAASPPPSYPAAASKLGEREFVMLMALLQALQAFSIDAMLPALGAMAGDLGITSDNHRQLVVGVFLVSAGLGALAPGPLADRFGRRPVLLCYLALFTLATAICALSPDFTVLLVARGIAGFVSAGLGVLPPTIIRDRFQGDAMARLQSLITMVFMLVPMLAPAIGQGILLLAGWRAIFGCTAMIAAIAAFWAWFRLEESLDSNDRQSLAPGAIASAMRDALLTRSAIGYVIGSALISGGLFSFINSAQQLLAEHFGMGAWFPLAFAAVALAMSTGNFVNSRIVMRFGTRRICHAALIGYLAMGLIQLHFSSQPDQTGLRFIVVMMGTLFMMGFIGGNFSAIALQPFGRIAGAAASTHSFVRMLVGALLGAMVGQFYDGSARPIALALTLAGAATLLLVLYSEEWRLFRRLNPMV